MNLVIVCGLPGTGKSTVASEISAKLGYPVFSVDPIESAIIKSGITKSFETGLAAYLVAQTLADEQLKLGHSVIIDAVSGVKEGKQMWRELLANNQAKLIVIENTCSDVEVHKERLKKRVRGLHGFPEVTWDDVEKQKREYTTWPEDRLVLDSLKPPKENAQRAIEYIATH